MDYDEACIMHKGLITLCVVSLAFIFLFSFLDFFSRFHLRFGYQHVGIQNKSENVRKTRDKHEKITQCKTNFSILHYALGKNASWLHFSCVWETFEV